MINKQYAKPKRLLRLLNERRKSQGLPPFKNWETVRHRLKLRGCKTIKIQNTGAVFYNISSAVKALELKRPAKKRKGTLNRFDSLIKAHQKLSLLKCMEERSFAPEFIPAKDALLLFNAIRSVFGRRTIQSTMSLWNRLKANNVPCKKGVCQNYYKATDVIALAYRQRSRQQTMLQSALPVAPMSVMQDPEYIELHAFADFADLHHSTLLKHIYKGNIVAYKSPQGILLHTPSTSAFFLHRAMEHPHSFKKKNHHHA